MAAGRILQLQVPGSSLVLPEGPRSLVTPRGSNLASGGGRRGCRRMQEGTISQRLEDNKSLSLLLTVGATEPPPR